MTMHPLRGEIEDFLYREADLLDNWQLREWTRLFTDDGSYLIPPLEAPDSDPSDMLFLVYDDRNRLEERAKRLLSKRAHAEFPHSQTRHLYSNVRIEELAGDELTARCNFVVYRSKWDVNDIYPGRSTYRLRRTPDGWRIASKRAALDLAVLRPQGKVSIIL